MTKTTSDELNTTTFLYTHRQWVECWEELTRIASSSYPLLTPESRDAYLALPQVIEECRESFLRIPEPVRPLHYLCT